MRNLLRARPFYFMSKEYPMNRLTPLFLVFLALSGCGKKVNQREADEAYLVADSAVSSLNGALNDSEQSASYARNRPAFELIPSAYAASCGLSRFSPIVGSSCSGTVANKTVTSDFSGCTAGRSDEFSLRGQVSLSFDSASTCDTWLAGSGLPTSGFVTRTTSNFQRTNPNGSVVTVTSASHTNYAGTTLGGGVTTTFGVGSRTVTIAGLRRVRTSADGASVFDHSVTTTTPIVITGTRSSGNRTVQSGAIRVDHNLARFSSATSISGLSWNTSCCHPIAGTLSFSLLGSSSGSITVDYATGSCGEANISRNGTFLARVDLPSCE